MTLSYLPDRQSGLSYTFAILMKDMGMLKAITKSVQEMNDLKEKFFLLQIIPSK